MNKKTTHEGNLLIVQDLVNILNKDDLSELEYECMDVKIKIVNNLNNKLSHTQAAILQSPKVNISDDNSKTIDKSERYTNKHSGAVNSPMVGTAYSSPEPGKEPFVKLNSSVLKGDTLLIIEAMKVMNSITAHKSGKIVFVGFEDGQPIEFNQLLVVIE